MKNKLLKWIFSLQVEEEVGEVTSSLQVEEEVTGQLQIEEEVGDVAGQPSGRRRSY